MSSDFEVLDDGDVADEVVPGENKVIPCKEVPRARHLFLP